MTIVVGAEVVWADDANEWTIENTGSGSVEVTLTDDETNEIEGDNCVLYENVSGSYEYGYIVKAFSPAKDWSAKDKFGFWMKGTNSGKTFRFTLNTDWDDRNWYYTTDDFTSWKFITRDFTDTDATSGSGADMSSIGHMAHHLNGAVVDDDVSLDRIIVYENAKALNCSDLQLTLHPVVAEWDGWESAAYKRRQKPYGGYRAWQLKCQEETSTSWTDSVVKALRDAIDGREDVTFDVDLDAYQFSGDTYVRGVDFQPENTDQIRYFTINIQEKM